MERYTLVQKNTYLDSLAALFSISVMMECRGIETAFVGMGTRANKQTLEELGLKDEVADHAREDDLIFAARAESRAAFEAAVKETQREDSGKETTDQPVYRTLEEAVRDNPRANICSISVPGEYAFGVTKQALELGLHCVVFSSHVPLEQEREMKQLAREKGLLCMGPDCGVANINGTAFVLSSINNRGPVGICGASGCGIQHIAAFLHQAGSGVSQTIGTGGSDLSEQVGGISMGMGIDALEEDPETEYLVLISRKPSERVLERLLERIKTCKKPVVACFMGTERQVVEASGAIWAEDLDDCAAKALALVGKKLELESEEELRAMARCGAEKMALEQRYVRGMFCGGTYCDEAMRTMEPELGDIYSNCPLRPELELSNCQGGGHTVIDYGEEEFTQGRPHPTLEPSMRLPAIQKAGEDPETAVILLDFILTPPANPDPAGVTVKAIRQAMDNARRRGGRLAVVASVLGTDADVQNAARQRETLRQAGVFVCRTNKQASRLAAEIIRQKNQEACHE